MTKSAFSNVDLTIKTARLKDNVRMQFRTEIFDLFTRPNFGQPGRIIESSSFSQILNPRFPPGDSRSARQIRFAAKLFF